jgi:hypothetical protein
MRRAGVQIRFAGLDEAGREEGRLHGTRVGRDQVEVAGDPERGVRVERRELGALEEEERLVDRGAGTGQVRGRREREGRAEELHLDQRRRDVTAQAAQPRGRQRLQPVEDERALVGTVEQSVDAGPDRCEVVLGDHES